jgi:ribonuclease HII
VLTHERQAKKKGYKFVIGVDEAGRGPLAGPVVVAAVCLKTHRFQARVDDSKKLTAAQRRKAFSEIIRKSFFGVGVQSEKAIDVLNISRACGFAADIAIEKILFDLKKRRPTAKNTLLLLDGALHPNLAYPSKEIIGGDGKSLSIASASIIAKVVRDRLMEIYDRVYPHYEFKSHKGYGTERHRRHIRRYGLSPIHRRTFCKNYVI